jgi:hypothetical protein
MTDVEQVEGSVETVVVERWRRYGHDRAYVRVAGEQVGYRDLKTGSVQCSDARYLGAVVESTEHLLCVAPTYSARHSRNDDAPPPTIPPRQAAPRPPRTPAPPPVLLPDRDLAGNEPGAETRDQAMALRDAAPVRSRIARLVGAKTDERSWRIGAEAEVAVARRLDKLPAGWRVLHAIPVGDKGSDIDHVVIGPPGVVTINTKHHPDAKVWVRGDTVKVNGHNQRYVRNSRHEAQRAASLLTAKLDQDVPVRAVIAIVGARDGFVVKEQPAGDTVSVVLHKRLAGYLRSLPVVLDSSDVERIYQAARHLATWQPPTVEWAEF